MSVLTTLVMRLFAAAHEPKLDEGRHSFNDFDDLFREIDGVSTTRSRRKRRKLRRLGQTRGRRDRTAWGTYIERAAPVLPSNTWVPGFENEALLIAKGVRQRQGAEDDWDDHEHFGDDEESDDEDERDDDEEIAARDLDGGLRPRRQRTEGSTPALASHGIPAFPSIRSLSDILPTSLTALNPFSSTSSSLFGSTTRPAARILEQPQARLEDLVEVPEEARAPSTQIIGPSRRSFLDIGHRLRSGTNMAPKTHLWVSLWFLLSAPIIIWDAGYCFMRPRSFTGGDLHWIWEPYGLYQNIDYVYGVEAYKRGDGFTNAQSALNIIETALNLYYLYVQHVLASPSAPVIGFASAVMTLSKTVLYWLQEYYCGGCSVGHNDLSTLFWYWIVPNGIWLIVPSLIIIRLYKDISSTLGFASKIASGKKN